jgi:hypothetical protein
MVHLFSSADADAGIESSGGDVVAAVIAATPTAETPMKTWLQVVLWDANPFGAVAAATDTAVHTVSFLGAASARLANVVGEEQAMPAGHVVLVSVRMERQAAHAVCLHRSGDGVVSSAGAVLLELKEVNGVSMAVCVATAMGDVVVHEVRAPSAAFSTPPPAFSSERVDVRGTLRLCWVWFSCARARVCVCARARMCGW